MHPMRPADLLTQIPVFQGLADEDCEALASRLTEKSVKAGDIVFAQGESGGTVGFGFGW